MSDYKNVGTVYAAISNAYEMMKLHVPVLYDLLMEKSLEWPKPTVNASNEELKGRSMPRLIVGTHILGEQQLQKTDLQKLRKYPHVGGLKSMDQIDISSNNGCQVDRVRFLPRNVRRFHSQTKISDGPFFSNTKPSAKCSSELHLEGRSKQSWQPNFGGQLWSSSNNCTVPLWDINATTKMHRLIRAKNAYAEETAIKEDVAWYKTHHPKVVLVGDRQLIIWDTRTHYFPKPIHIVDGGTEIVKEFCFKSY